MAINVTMQERMLKAERENKLLKESLRKAQAIVDYVVALDYPEVIEEEEEETENE